MDEYGNKGKPTTLIAISGKFASGKTTLMKELSKRFENLSLVVEHLSIAGFLKYLCIAGYGMLEGEENKDRTLLIKVGEALRQINEDVFINIVNNKVKKTNADVIIIDDLRFINEAETLDHWFQIRIDAPEELRIKRIKEKYPDTFQKHLEHINNKTETQLDSHKFDTHIQTNWSSDDIDELIRMILNK